MNYNKPLVSISCITYNHEPYIRDCIEGFLMQKTNFPFEILIHDDASADGTASIIKEYEKKYPKLIYPIYQQENQYSKGIIISPTYVWPRAHGKYIALCEGDDYWTDPLKLQKQVDFLEANEEYGMVHSDTDFLSESKRKIVKSYYQTRISNIPRNDAYNNILKSNYPIVTCTVVFRSDLLKKVNFEDMMKFKSGDTFLWLSLSLHTKFHYFDVSTAVRRLLVESVSQTKNIKKLHEFKKQTYELFHYFIEKHGCADETKKQMDINRNNSLFFSSYFSRDKQMLCEIYNNLKVLKKLKHKHKVYYYASSSNISRSLLYLAQTIYQNIKNIYKKKNEI